MCLPRLEIIYAKVRVWNGGKDNGPDRSKDVLAQNINNYLECRFFSYGSVPNLSFPGCHTYIKKGPMIPRIQEGSMWKEEKDVSRELGYYRFGSIALLRGYVTLFQIQQALAEQVEDNVSAKPHRLLGTILREKGWITEEQETSILEEMWEKADRETATKIG